MLGVIGSGFGRTGTTSLKVALEQLGFGRCYHMQEVLQRPSHMRAWGAWEPGVTADPVEVFDGFGAAVDFPACLLYGSLLDQFPDAKVVHTVRDLDRWYDSTIATIYEARLVLGRPPWSWVPPVRSLYRMLDHVIWDGVFDGRFEDRAHAIAVHERWTEQVVATVPADRLLVFDVAEGWEPLCAFLDVPVPDRPFPRVNDKAVFRRRIQALRLLPWALLAAAGAGGAVAASRCRTRLVR